MDYSTKLKRPEWQKKRLKIFERDNWTCQYCGSTEFTLNVHHEKYVGQNPEDTPDEFLKTACEDCHHLITIFNSLKPRLEATILNIKISYVAQDKSIWMRKVTFSDGKVMMFLYGNMDANQRILSFTGDQYKEFIKFIAND